MGGVSKRRVTIRDIAARVGVSEAAASFALNGKAGVSDETRQRVLAMAHELDWSPNHAARVLSGARTGTIGLVIARNVQDVGTESFFLRLMTGIQSVLGTHNIGLMLQVVESVHEEIATYKRWKLEGRVDGVIVVDLRTADPRPEALAALGLTAILAGGPDPQQLIPGVTIDDAASMGLIITHLHDYGHRNVAYICGDEEMQHIQLRRDAIVHASQAFGAMSADTMSAITIPTEFSADAASIATETTMLGPNRPTALIYDNEVLALAGIGTLRRLGLCIPEDVTIIVWEDTALCRAIDPPLTALQRDTFTFGSHIAERLLELLDGAHPTDQHEPLPTLAIRASSGTATPRPTQTKDQP